MPKLMDKNLKLPTGHLSHPAFLLDEVTIRNVENGRMDQANKTLSLTCLAEKQPVPKPAGNWKGIVWEPNKMYVANGKTNSQAKSSMSGSATQRS